MLASELRVGDALVGHDGQAVAVEAVEDAGEWARVYNLRVAEDHTYFVGCDEWGFSLWTHNAYGEMRATLPGVSERVAQRAYLHATTGPAATRWQRFRDYLQRNGVSDLDQRRAAFHNAHATGPGHGAAGAAELGQNLRAAELANPVLDSLRTTGQLPPHFVDKAAANAAGWQPGKALNNKVPGGQIGGDIFQSPASIGLPVAPGRIWREADIGIINTMSRSKQPGTRLLYFNDGLAYVTPSHYKTIYQVPNWR